MRILHICAYSWSIGGPPKVIYDHAEVALRHGHAVTIASPLSPGEKVYPVPAGGKVVTFPRTEPVSRFFREFSVGLHHYLKSHIHEFDIIHCHGLWHYGALAPFLLDRRVAKVVTIHGLLDRWALRQSYWKKWLMSSLFQKRYLRRADLIHLINPDEKDDLLRHLGYHHPRTIVIPNGVRVSDFAHRPPAGTFRRAFSLPEEKKLVLFLSRLNRKKGLDLLLPAFKQYCDANPDALLIIAGPDDGYEAQVRAFVAEHALTDSIRLVGMLTGD
ncbi:MAG: glycosyltransferase, partial [Bacteroidetes bacterium]|nr:glycosyltransferase [Fibrella sp.]